MIEDGELIGHLYRVPDKWWGFEAYGRVEHPGACVGYDRRGVHVTMLKGTDPKSARYEHVHVLVDASDSNGLSKQTAFQIQPRTFRARRVALLYPERFLGSLSSKDLERMQAELIRLFGGEE